MGVVTPIRAVVRNATTLRKPADNVLQWSKGYGDMPGWAVIFLLHERRGHRYKIQPWGDAGWIGSRYFDTAGGKSVPISAKHHVPMHDVSKYWQYNEIAIQVNSPSLMAIGTPEELWNEICEARPLAPDRTPEQIAEADLILQGEECVYFHPMGHSYKAEKSLSHLAVPEYARMLADATGLMVLVDNHYHKTERKMPPANHPRVRYVTGTMAAKFEVWSRCKLIVGIDSATLHCARFAWGVPSIGMWLSRRQTAMRYTLPTPNRINLYPGGYRDLYGTVGTEWNCEPCGHWTVPPKELAERAVAHIASCTA